MSNIIGISGSPRINKGSSYNYLKRVTNKIISSYIYNNKDLKLIKKSDTIIFSFPLFVDCLPSHFLKFLIELDNNKITSKNIYVICNLGFYEGKQGNIAIEIMRNWCHRTNNNYMGALVIGGGPLFNYPIIKLKPNHYLKKLSNCAINSKLFNDKYIAPLLPRCIYYRCGNMSFKKDIKKNVVKKKTII